MSAADRAGETFTAILETFSTVIRQPVRWLSYTAYALVAGKVASFVYAYFCFRAVQFIGWSAGLGGGDRAEQLRAWFGKKISKAAIEANVRAMQRAAGEVVEG